MEGHYILGSQNDFSYPDASKEKEKSITEDLEEMAVNICKHNNKGKCHWVIEGNICPLRKLY